MSNIATTKPSRSDSRSRASAGGVLAVALALVLSGLAAVAGPPTPASAATTFGGWEFTASVSSSRSDGMSLEDVSYNGLKIFDRVSMPAMTVYYDFLCGPYIDRIGGSSYTPEGPIEYTVDGVRWMQIGITDEIGAYVITQMFYLSEDGDFDVHMFSKGLQCNFRHDHYPFLRMDFDLAGAGADEIIRATSDGPVTMTEEFSLSATAAVNHGWQVRDAVTGDVVTIDFDDNNPGRPGEEVRPREDYEDNFVYGRNDRAGEDEWQGRASRQLFGDNGETIEDTVVWYRGYLPHSPAEGPDLWHSTGIRMRVVPQSGPGSITGVVSDLSGNPVPGVKVDLFTESRADFVEAVLTDEAGSFSFEVDPGCKVLTFIAPDGSTLQGGGRFLNRAVCVVAGETSDGNDAVVALPGSGAASVGGAVVYLDGSAATGARANLFSENRQEFLALAAVDETGRYSFELASPQCGVVTLIAPDGETFAQNASRFLNRSFCAEAGDAITDLDGQVVSSAEGAAIGGSITDADQLPVPGVRVVYYLANEDGGRGPWLGRALSGQDGSFSLSVAPACHVLDLVAPEGRTWEGTGGRYDQRVACVEPGQSIDDIAAVLASPS
jgi:hypothetical protein